MPHSGCGSAALRSSREGPGPNFKVTGVTVCTSLWPREEWSRSADSPLIVHLVLKIEHLCKLDTQASIHGAALQMGTGSFMEPMV